MLPHALGRQAWLLVKVSSPPAMPDELVRDGSARRVQPWSVILTDLDTGAILDVVDGPRGKTVKAWLLARPRWWRRRIEYVAIDMSAEFRAAIHQALPWARISVDHWHVVRLANEMVTTVRFHSREG